MIEKEVRLNDKDLFSMELDEFYDNYGDLEVDPPFLKMSSNKNMSIGFAEDMQEKAWE